MSTKQPLPLAPQKSCGPDSADPEAGGRWMKNQFNTSAQQKTFIRKFYVFLIGQLAVTVLVTELIINYGKQLLPEQLDRNIIWWMSVIIIILVVAILFCLGDSLRKWPVSLISLCLFTVAFSIFLGCTSVYADIKGIKTATMIVMMVICCLVILTFVPPLDFTVGWVICPLVVFIVVCCAIALELCKFVKLESGIALMFAGFVASVFCLYIVLKTGDMVTNNHYLLIEPSEYIYGCLILYTDVINLLVFILTLVQARQ